MHCITAIEPLVPRPGVDVSQTQKELILYDVIMEQWLCRKESTIECFAVDFAQAADFAKKQLEPSELQYMAVILR